jgi:polyisoprenoid-binding protein YceI
MRPAKKSTCCVKPRTLGILGGLVLNFLGITGFSATYSIDSVHSNVGFSIRHFLTNVKGTFTDFSGTIDFDPKNPTGLKVDAVVQAESINTNNQKRDNHLRTEDFFHVTKFKTLSFKSKEFKPNGSLGPSGEGKGKLMGVLDMRGVKRDITMDVEIHGTMPDFEGNPRVSATATAIVNRKDFNINWNKALDNGGWVVGDEVKITIEIAASEATPAPQTPPAPAAKKS